MADIKESGLSCRRTSYRILFKFATSSMDTYQAIGNYAYALEDDGPCFGTRASWCKELEHHERVAVRFGEKIELKSLKCLPTFSIIHDEPWHQNNYLFNPLLGVPSPPFRTALYRILSRCIACYRNMQVLVHIPYRSYIRPLAGLLQWPPRSLWSSSKDRSADRYS